MNMERILATFFLHIFFVVILRKEYAASVPSEGGWSSGADPLDNNGLAYNTNTFKRASITKSSAVKVRPTRPLNSKYIANFKTGYVYTVVQFDWQ